MFYVALFTLNQGREARKREEEGLNFHSEFPTGTCSCGIKQAQGFRRNLDDIKKVCSRVHSRVRSKVKVNVQVKFWNELWNELWNKPWNKLWDELWNILFYVV